MSDLASYRDLIARKAVAFQPRGLESVPALSPHLKPHQAHCVDFALRAGSAALFLDTGLGKTLCALDWGRVIVEHTGKPVLMLAPLAVAAQHERMLAFEHVREYLASPRRRPKPGTSFVRQCCSILGNPLPKYLEG